MPLFSYLLLTLALLTPTDAADAPRLADQARAILQTSCSRCHNTEGKAKGGFGYVLDRDRLVAQDKLVPGSADQSPLFQRIIKGEMPPKEQRPRPSPAEVALLKQWIDAGAPALSA